jgi:Methyltransferase domain
MNPVLPKAIAGKIMATPNPVPAEAGALTTLHWEVNAPEGAEVYVSESGAPEKLVGRGRNGSLEVEWIQAGTDYLFHLYSRTEPRRILDSVIVRRCITGRIRASPNPVSLESGSKTLLEWEITPPAVAEIYLSENGGSEKLVCRGASGSFEFGELQGGSKYVMTLYTATEPRQILDSIVVQRPITGRIRASPNPVPLEAGSKTLLEWEITAPAVAEIYVSENGEREKLVCRGTTGSVKLEGLQCGNDYVVTLRAATEPRRNLDTITVRRMDIPWKFLLDELRSGADWQEQQITEIGEFVTGVVSRYLHHPKFLELFRLWEKHGFHVTPVHFYQPIPDTRSLPETLWSHPSRLVGINMNDALQLDLLRKDFPKFRTEYQQFPIEPAGEPSHFYLNNGLFDGTDALVAYCMIRHFHPRLIIEVGSGFSSLLLGQAATKNNNSALICIEPFPQEFLKHGFRGLHSLIEKKVQDMDLDFFSQLGPGDVLFIDSSHTVKIGGDVNYLFLEVLPRLKPGVIVHVHDIFFPFDYRRDWVKEEFRFWTEQYLLQAFLAFNSEFEVLMANRYVAHKYSEDFKAAFPSLEKLKANSKDSISWGGGSFWMRRKPTAGLRPIANGA